jgi:hypothetical protein
MLAKGGFVFNGGSEKRRLKEGRNKKPRLSGAFCVAGTD